MSDKLVHTTDGRLIEAYKIPGTKVTRKKGLPYGVHSSFPVGEVRMIGPECGRLNERQDPLRPYAHVRIEEEGRCFHAYADTLEVVDD